MPSQTPAQIGTLNEAARLINEGRPAEALALLDRPATAWLDGERIGPVRRISARVEVDAAHVVV